MERAMEEDGLLFQILTKALPSLMTVVAGGVLASTMFPRLQRSYQRTLQTEEKKIELSEAVVRAFSRYVAAWSRLIAISELEADRALSEEEQSRKQEYVEDRKNYRDELFDGIQMAQLYFSDEFCSELKKFAEWDALQSTKTLSELPPISEWKT